jgi:DNA-binding response OmpR family regulator
MMPEMDGYELCEKVKNDVRTSQFPLILLTHIQPRNRNFGDLRQVPDDYITKPINFDILLLRII